MMVAIGLKLHLTMEMVDLIERKAAHQVCGH